MFYKCEGCENTFEGSPAEAFKLGWDTPEMFMSHCTCPDCPITVTAWWRIMVDKKPMSRRDAEIIRGYNEIWRTQNG